jgi:hypothetical protein
MISLKLASLSFRFRGTRLLRGMTRRVIRDPAASHKFLYFLKTKVLRSHR